MGRSDKASGVLLLAAGLAALGVGVGLSDGLVIAVGLILSSAGVTFLGKESR